MTPQPEKLAWSIAVECWHHSSYGHRLTLVTEGDNWQRVEARLITWRRGSIDDAGVRKAAAFLEAALVEQLALRYGIQPTIEPCWEGEPDPF